MVNYINNNYNLSIQVEVVIGNEEPNLKPLNA